MTTRDVERPKPRPHLAQFRSLPAPISHVSTIEGFMSAWDEMRFLATDKRVLRGLRPFALRLSEAFFDDTADRAVEALRRGDCAFFVAVQIRLDQLHCAVLARGGTLADCAPVIRAKFMATGFLDAAIESLRRKGGRWPPEAPTLP